MLLREKWGYQCFLGQILSQKQRQDPEAKGSAEVDLDQEGEKEDPLLEIDQEAVVLAAGPDLAVGVAEGGLEQDQAEDRVDLEEEVEIEVDLAADTFYYLGKVSNLR